MPFCHGEKMLALSRIRRQLTIKKYIITINKKTFVNYSGCHETMSNVIHVCLDTNY